MATTYLTRTFSSPTNRKIWTWSAWVKRQNLVSNYANAMFGAYYDGNNRSVIRFDTHELNFQDSANSVEIKTNRLFRDISAWYHIVAAVDTTQGTASDRIRLYVNGEQQTSFRQADYPAQNDNMQFNGADPHYINGRNSSGSVDSIADMSYSHVHFCDGTALAPTVFGETDATTGEWKIKTDPSFTLGTNGFTILKDGNTITDQSTNSNNFSLGGGTLTKTEDSPSNVFATMNPLSTISTLTYASGNTQITGVNSYVWKTVFSTLGMNYGSSGKYYYEIKVATLDLQTGIGVWGEPLPQTVTSNFFPNHHPFGFVYKEDGSVSDDSQTFYTGSSYTSGDIIQCALDIDNSKIYFGKGGVWQNSGDPTSGATGTGAVPLEDNGGGAYFFFGTSYGTDVIQANFGNGYFGTTAVSSAGTNASGNGIFEYDVPTGYTALSTKGLNL